jgi:teichoic acid transport system permease protein
VTTSAEADEGGQTEETRMVAADGLFNVGRPLPVTTYLRTLWQRRDFVIQVPLGRLEAQTSSTLLGSLWHLINPLLSAVIYYFVFGILFGGREDIPNYGAFLVTGLVAYIYTQRTAVVGARSITGSRALLSQLNFPRTALPLSATIAEAISHVWAVAATLAVVVVTGEPLTLQWLWLVPAVALQTLFNLGFAMIVARLTFHFKDVENLLPHLLRLWMYISGLFFTIDFVAATLGGDSIVVALFPWNPAYAFMSLTRGALLADHAITTEHWLVAVVWSVGLLIVGFTYFRAREIEYGSV